MSLLKRAASWLGQNLWALAGFVIAALGAGVLWNLHRGRVRRLEDEVAIKDAVRKVTALDSRRQALAERADENRVEIEAVQAERVEIVRSAVAVERRVEGMSDDDLEAEFRRLY